MYATHPAYHVKHMYPLPCVCRKVHFLPQVAQRMGFPLLCLYLILLKLASLINCLTGHNWPQITHLMEGYM